MKLFHEELMALKSVGFRSVGIILPSISIRGIQESGDSSLHRGKECAVARPTKRMMT